jgi:hypothetical protein
MHDKISGLVATKGKEQIEKQMEHGGKGLVQQDRQMVEINLKDLGTSSGERESYWLIAIQAARARYRIQQ